MFFGGGVDTSLFGDKVRRMAAQGLVARTVVNSGVSNVGILCGAKILQHDELLFEREFMGGELQCHIVSFSVRYHVQAHGMDGAVSITHDAEDVVAMSTSLNQLAAEGWMLRVGMLPPLLDLIESCQPQCTNHQLEAVVDAVLTYIQRSTFAQW